MLKTWVNLKTENFLEVTSLCEKTFKFSLFYCLIGFPGAGKTTAFNFYCKSNKNAIYLRLDKTYKPKDFYVALLRLCGVGDYGYDQTLLQLSNKLAKTLNSRPEKTILIIDDAGRFQANFMEHFQAVRDLTETKVGIILSGTAKYKKDFESWVVQNLNGIPELNSRILDWIILKQPKKTELKSVAMKNGITDTEELAILVKTCDNFRSLYNEVLKLLIARNPLGNPRETIGQATTQES